jgi:hypothetical protein
MHRKRFLLSLSVGLAAIAALVPPGAGATLQ